MSVLLFFVLFIGQLRRRIYEKKYFFRRLFLVNSQIASVLTGLNYMHLRTHLGFCEIIYISFEKVRNIFLKDF